MPRLMYCMSSAAMERVPTLVRSFCLRPFFMVIQEFFMVGVNRKRGYKKYWLQKKRPQKGQKEEHGGAERKLTPRVVRGVCHTTIEMGVNAIERLRLPHPPTARFGSLAEMSG